MNLELEKIIIKAKRAVFSENIGNNISPFKGEGYDFMELREYETGDDIKKINWNISAKLNKLYVKVFHEQRAYRVNIISLLCGSTEFGNNVKKKDKIAEIAAIISFSSIKQGDNFSNFILNNSIELVNAPTKNMSTVYSVANKIYKYDALGKSLDINKINYDLFHLLNKKSICFLIGDFLDIQNFNLSLLYSKHEVLVVIVRDLFEENPQHLGLIDAIDPSTLESYHYTIDENSVVHYKEHMKQNDHRLFEHLQSLGIRWVKIYTHEKPMSKLRNLFGY